MIERASHEATKHPPKAIAGIARMIPSQRDVAWSTRRRPDLPLGRRSAGLERGRLRTTCAAVTSLFDVPGLLTDCHRHCLIEAFRAAPTRTCSSEMYTWLPASKRPRSSLAAPLAFSDAVETAEPDRDRDEPEQHADRGHSTEADRCSVEPLRTPNRIGLPIAVPPVIHPLSRPYRDESASG